MKSVLHSVAYSLIATLAACASSAPDVGRHALDCALGVPWSDCQPGTPGYVNNGGSPIRTNVIAAERKEIHDKFDALATQCKADMQTAELDRIRNKVELLRSLKDAAPDARFTANRSYPTNEEREAIGKWNALRQTCIARQEQISSVPVSATAAERAYDEEIRKMHTDFNGKIGNLIALLSQGKLTYGDFAQQRYQISQQEIVAQGQLRAATIRAGQMEKVTRSD